MFVNLLTFVISFAYLRLVTGETTKEPLKEIQQRSTLKSNADNMPSSDTWDVSPTSRLNSLWAYRSPQLQPRQEQEPEVYQVPLKAPFAITRLAKSHVYGFDPYFKKGYFEPFERRQRPVTLVAFRRNGLLPKHTVKIEDSESAEIAEMQSPFNDISSLWKDEPRLMNY